MHYLIQYHYQSERHNDSYGALLGLKLVTRNEYPYCCCIVHNIYLTFTYGYRIKSHLKRINEQVLLVSRCLHCNQIEINVQQKEVCVPLMEAIRIFQRETTVIGFPITYGSLMHSCLSFQIIFRSLAFSKHMCAYVMNSKNPWRTCQINCANIECGINICFETEWIKWNDCCGKNRDDSLFMLVELC